MTRTTRATTTTTTTTEPTWTQPRPGIAFRDGKVYQFGRGEIVVLGRPWPDPRAWRKRKTTAWRGFRPLLPRRHLLAPPPPNDPPAASCQAPRCRQERIVAAWAAWWHQVPAHVQSILAENEAALWGRWDLLNLLARAERAVDLVESSPGLGIAVAANRAFRRSAKPRRTARRLARLRQSDALAWLGFYGTESTARLVRRVPAQCATVRLMLDLRRRLVDAEARRLLAHHAPTIDPATVDLLDPALVPHLTAGLVEDVSSGTAFRSGGPGPAALLRDLLRMADAVPGAIAAGRVRSVEQLVEVHDGTVRALRRRRWTPSATRFGPPPVPGTTWMVPLTTSAALAAEGEAMGHCVGVYAGMVAAGLSYLYAVRGWGVDRSTAELVRGRGGWRLRQLLGPENVAVGERTKEKVAEYLRRERRRAGGGWGRWRDAAPGCA